MEIIGKFSCKVEVIGESLVAPRINETEGIVYLQNGSYWKSESLFALRINEVEVVVCLQSEGYR